VEFTLAASVLMLFIVGVFEFSRLYYARFRVRHQIAEASRLAATGTSLINPDTGEEMSRAESVTYFIETGAGSLPVVLESVVLDPADGGGPGDVVEIQANYRFTFLSSALIRSFAPSVMAFTVSAVVKNEPRF
jgi:Flp pilus assembly protein TadG